MTAIRPAVVPSRFFAATAGTSSRRGQKSWDEVELVSGINPVPSSSIPRHVTTSAIPDSLGLTPAGLARADARSFRGTSFLPVQLTLSSVAGWVKKVQCIGRAPQAERGLISMRKSNGRAWAAAVGQRVGKGGGVEGCSTSKHDMPRSEVGNSFQARKRRCNECRLQGYRGGS